MHVANILAKRVGTGRIEVAQDDQVFPPCFERLGLANEALEACQSKLADQLATVESQYG